MKKMQNPSPRNRKGFTLIELIVVIAILAILAAIAIPAFTGTLNRSKQKTHDANVRVIESAIALYCAETGNAADTVDAINTLIPTYLKENPDDPLTSAVAGGYSVTDGAVTPAYGTYTRS